MSFTKPNIATSAATFAQLQSSGLSGILELLITANGPATLAPTAAPTGAGSSSGHTLPATTYYATVTELNGAGETTNGGQVSSGIVISTGEEMTITYASLQTGNTARNLYIGTSSTGPFYLAASGVTTSTTVITAPLPTNSYAVQPPTVNSTAFEFVDAQGATDSTTLQLIRAAKTNRLQAPFDYAQAALRDWNHGDPIPSGAILQKLRHAAIPFAVVLQAILDAGALVDANAGTIYPSTDGGVGTVAGVRRSWP